MDIIEQLPISEMKISEKVDEIVLNGNVLDNDKDLEQNSDNHAEVIERPVTPAHPLNSSWTLWYYLKEKNISWQDSQKKVSTFNTVEDFWSLLNHIENASRLKSGCDYSLFRTGIRPEWEDSQNREGGKWHFSTLKQYRETELDTHFVEMAMMLIGENEDPEVMEQLNGIVVSARPKNDRIALWTKTVNNRLVDQAGQIMKKTLRCKPRSLEFITHRDSASKIGSQAKISRYL